MNKEELLKLLESVDHSEDANFNQDGSLKVSNFEGITKALMDEHAPDFKRVVEKEVVKDYSEMSEEELADVKDYSEMSEEELADVKDTLDSAVDEAKKAVNESQKALKAAIQERDDFILENVSETTNQTAIDNYLSSQKKLAAAKAKEKK